MTTTALKTKPAKTKSARYPVRPRLPEAEEYRPGHWRAYVWDSRRRVKVWATNPEDGTTSFTEKWLAKVAQGALYDRMTAVYADLGNPLMRKQLRHPFPEVAREWLAKKEREPGKRGAKERGGTPQTHRARKSAVNVLCRKFPKADIVEVDQDRFLDFLAEEEETGYSSATIESRVVYMRQIQKFAQARGYIENDCTEGISIMVEREKNLRYLTDLELCLLTCYVPMWFIGTLLLAYDCGLRAAEVAGLRWCRLDLDARVPKATVKDVMEPNKELRSYPKGKITETVSLTPRCVDALRVLKAMRPDDDDMDFVFRNANGTTMAPSEPSRILKAVWEATGLDGARPTFHALRHSCATNLADAGAPMEVIMERMRHKNPAVTMKYIRRSLERQADWSGRVQDMADAQVISLYNERKRREQEKAGVVPTPQEDGSVTVSAVQWAAMMAMLAAVAPEGTPVPELALAG